jgi:hypothetical protein
MKLDSRITKIKATKFKMKCRLHEKFYLFEDSSLSTMSRICRASCGASARFPAKN